jgi:hypothetical protein
MMSVAFGASGHRPPNGDGIAAALGGRGALALLKKPRAAKVEVMLQRRIGEAGTHFLCRSGISAQIELDIEVVGFAAFAPAVFVVV